MGAVIPVLMKSRKNSTGSEFVRRRFNFIEGTGITITMADDSGDNEIDVTFAGSAQGPTMGMVQAINAGLVKTAITALS